MRIIALILFGILSLILGPAAILWTLEAFNWAVTGHTDKDLWRGGYLLMVIGGWSFMFAWWDVKKNKNWPNKTKRIIVEYVDKDGNPVEVK